MTEAQDPPAGEPTRIAGNAALTAAAGVVTMGVGALLAIVIVLKFGKTARTDGFFAAYSVYGVTVIVAQSLRTSIVARLVEAPRLEDGLNRFLPAVTALFVLAGIPLVALSGPLGDLLIGDLGDEAAGTARDVLMILWPATGAQLLAALCAAALGIRGDFMLPAVAYAAGGVLSIGLVFALSGPIGILAVPVSLVAGAALTTAMMVARLVSAGWRPTLFANSARKTAADSMLVLNGAVTPVIGQAGYVVSIALAARISEGSVTLYSYAFVASAMIIAVTAAPIGLVLAAPLSETWDRRPATLVPHLLAVTRAGLLVAAPVVAAVAVAGDDLARLILGSSLSDDDVRTLIATFLWLSGTVFANLCFAVPQLAAFAKGQYAAVAVIAAIGAAFHVGFGLLALETGRLEAIAAATSASTIVLLLMVLGLVFRRSTGHAVGLLVREFLTVALLAAATFGPLAAVAGATDSVVVSCAAVAAALALFGLLVWRLLPEHRRIVLALFPGRRAASA